MQHQLAPQTGKAAPTTVAAAGPMATPAPPMAAPEPPTVPAPVEVKVPEAASGERSLTNTLQAIATVGPPITVITALLFYFGWKRSNVQAVYLGIDESVLGMSTQDYLMRSTSSLFLPLAGIAAAALAWVLVNEHATRLIERRWRPSLLAWLVKGLLVAGLACLLLGARTVPTRREDDLVGPLALVVGLLVATWAVHLGRRVAAVTDRRATAPRPPWQAPLAKALVGVLVALGLFWEVTNYAGVVGRGYGQLLAAEVAARTGVVVYSPKRLYIQAPGVHEDELADPDAAYRFRYTGLRLLQRSGGNTSCCRRAGRSSGRWSS
jgi:hypothetical protein